MKTEPPQELTSISEASPAKDENHGAEIIEEPASPAKRVGLGALVVVIIWSGTILYGLGVAPLLGPDEPRYAEVAREMLATGDYVTPRLCGCPWFEKPVLLYWMSAASYKLFGVGEFAARFPSAFCALATALCLYFVLASRVSTRAATISSAVLVTSPLFIGYGRAAVMDMPLTAALSIAFLAFYMAVTSENKAKAGWWTVAWAAAGVAVLAKGLVGLLLFGGIISVVLLVCRIRAFNNWRYWAGGTAVFLAVALTWYLPVVRQNGYSFVQEFFINHHFKRYLTNDYHHPEPFYFYPAIMFAGLAPWAFLFIPALSRLVAWMNNKGRRYSPVYVLAAVWFVAPLLFFSFSASKLPGYILPAVPAACILIGIEAERAWTGRSSRGLTIAAYLAGVSMVALCVAFPLSAARWPGIAELAGRPLAWAPLAVAICALAALSIGRARLFIGGLCGSMTALVLAATVLALPQVGNRLSSKKLSLEVADALRPGEQIAFYVDRDYAPVFYAQGRVACGGKLGDVLNALGSPDLTAALQSRESLVVITPPALLEWIQRNPKLLMEPAPIACERDECAVRVMLRPQPPASSL